jgi:SAM-dependent methyltransferase
MSAGNALETSYRMQAAGEELMGMPSFYAAPASVDCWRHTRMLASVNVLVRQLPDAKWLTVGDGRYGSDAGYLTSLGADALATSLTDERLKRGAELGFIKKFKIENAERLSFADGEFDFVFCKEAYHHFPRPPVALYEMLRVARVGVVMIEPCDNPRLLDVAKRWAKRLLRGDSEFNYEVSGNFLYRLHIGELGKLMCAMGNHTLAVRGINDFYVARFAGKQASRSSKAFWLTRLGIGLQDVLARLRLVGWGLCCVVVFNGTPPAALLAALKRDGFSILELPKNPYQS